MDKSNLIITKEKNTSSRSNSIPKNRIETPKELKEAYSKPKTEVYEPKQQPIPQTLHKKPKTSEYIFTYFSYSTHLRASKFPILHGRLSNGLSCSVVLQGLLYKMYIISKDE